MAPSDAQFIALGEGDKREMVSLTLVCLPYSSKSFLCTTPRSSEAWSHGQLTAFKFKDFFLTKTELESGASLSVSGQLTMVSGDMRSLELPPQSP